MEISAIAASLPRLFAQQLRGLKWTASERGAQGHYGLMTNEC